jgi:hypothetical protein
LTPRQRELLKEFKLETERIAGRAGAADDAAQKR